jgi:flagellar basal body-associated protein FliL
MRQFKLWFCSLLLLIANMANSQTSESTIPAVEDLTDGIRAFICKAEGSEMPLIFVKENSNWKIANTDELDLISELDDGFMLRASNSPDLLGFLKEDNSNFKYQLLTSRRLYEAECNERNDFLELVVEVISPKIFENANNLEEKIEMLELQVKQLEQNQQEKVDTATPLPEPTVYYELEESLTTNLKESRRFLQIGLGISTDNGQEVIRNIETHLTTLKSDILAALSEYTEEMVVGREARKLLAEDIKSVINKRLKMLGDFGEVGEVFFTSYMMQ